MAKKSKIMANGQSFFQRTDCSHFSCNQIGNEKKQKGKIERKTVVSPSLLLPFSSNQSINQSNKQPSIQLNEQNINNFEAFLNIASIDPNSRIQVV